MKVTKPMIIAALVAGNLLAWNLALCAQDSTNAPVAGAPPAGQRPPGMRGGPTLDQLTQQLSLTDGQKAKVKTVLEARDKKIGDLRSDTSLSQEDRRAKMQAIRQDVTTQLKAILTAEQFDKFQKMSPMGRGFRNGPPGGARAWNTNAPATTP